MAYEWCGPRQKQVMDALMNMQPGNGDLATRIAQQIGVKPARVKRLVYELGMRYSIDTKRFNLCNRLVYLRAKELGLIGGGQ